MISIYLSCTIKNFKIIIIVYGTWSSPSTTHSNHLKKQGNNFTKLVALIFPPEFDELLFDDKNSF